MKRIGINMKGMFNTTSSRPYEYGHVKYFCMSCGHQHKEIACPKCGSKMKRIGGNVSLQIICQSHGNLSPKFIPLCSYDSSDTAIVVKNRPDIYSGMCLKIAMYGITDDLEPPSSKRCLNK